MEIQLGENRVLPLSGSHHQRKAAQGSYDEVEGTRRQRSFKSLPRYRLLAIKAATGPSSVVCPKDSGLPLAPLGIEIPQEDKACHTAKDFQLVWNGRSKDELYGPKSTEIEQKGK